MNPTTHPDAITRLLSPRRVAVIGASADPGTTAGRPVAYLQKHGFSGDIYPVNPKADRIGDLTCYPDIASLPEVPDVGIVLLGAERAHLAVRALAARGSAAAIVLASGNTETGEEGARALLNDDPGRVAPVDLPALALDLDTPADVAALKNPTRS